MEEWKTIPGYEGLYEISTDGRVRNLNYYRKKGNVQELKPRLNGGYLKIWLFKKGKGKLFRIHVLLAMTFFGYVLNNHTLLVDHINNNPLDNKLENLQIITNRENSSKDKKGNLPTGVSIIGRKFRARIMIDGTKKHIGTFSTPEEASEAYQKELKNI